MLRGVNLASIEPSTYGGGSVFRVVQGSGFCLVTYPHILLVQPLQPCQLTHRVVFVVWLSVRL